MKAWERQIQRIVFRRVLPFVCGWLLVCSQTLATIAMQPPDPPQPSPVATPSPSPSPSPTPNPTPNPTPSPSPSPTSPAETITPTGVSQPDPDAKPKIELPEDPFEPVQSPEEKKQEQARYQTLLEADRLYQAGDIDRATALYKSVKPTFQDVQETPQAPPPVTDPEQLPPAGQVYWREAKAGFESNMKTRAKVAIDLLLENYPQFIPGNLLATQIYDRYGQSEQSLKLMDHLAATYPKDPEVIKAHVAALAKAEKWIEASIAARQFALLNPDSPQAEEFTQLADENLQRYRKALRQKITGNVIGNVITGAIGYALTGGLLGPFTAAQSVISLLQGESGVGASVAKQVKRQLTMVKDEEINAYVNELGNQIAKIAGRKDFKYEFNVILDDTLNAFALPGGKVFVNLGAIAKTRSEAELAGLMGHEISHAVLTHGFQLMAQGNLISSIVGYVPYVGGLASNVIVFNYSRDMERQADELGTRLLASTGYAADGLRSLMLTLQAEERKDRSRPRPPEWLSTHPGSAERVKNIETVVVQSGYNRYAYEGVERHAVLREKAGKLIKEEKARLKDRKNRQRDRTDQENSPS